MAFGSEYVPNRKDSKDMLSLLPVKTVKTVFTAESLAGLVSVRAVGHEHRQLLTIYQKVNNRVFLRIENGPMVTISGGILRLFVIRRCMFL